MQINALGLTAGFLFRLSTPGCNGKLIKPDSQVELLAVGWLDHTKPLHFQFQSTVLKFSEKISLSLCKFIFLRH